MLEIQSLVVRRGGRVVLENLSCSLSPASVHGLVGRNGAGKTTLLEAIAGSVRTSSGNVRLAGREVRGSEVTFMPTNTYIYPGLSGREYLELFGKQNRRLDVDAWATEFDLPLEQLTETLSTGERQKLALVAAVSLARPLLLLDEPFGGLDFKAIEVSRTLLKRLAASGVLVVLATHAVDVLASVADAIHLLDQGVVAWSSRGTDLSAQIGDLRSRMHMEHAAIDDLARQVSP